MDIQIKKLSFQDIGMFRELIRVFENVFEMTTSKMPGEKYLMQLLARDDFFVFVAVADNKVLGGLTAYVLQQYYSVSPVVFIYDIAIEVNAQRQGVGKLLILNLANYCRDNGFEEMFVLADEVDEHAIKFYRSTGAVEGRVVNFNYLLDDKYNSGNGIPNR